MKALLDDHRVVVMHEDCVPCLAEAMKHTGEEAAMRIAIMMRLGEADGLIEDMCFKHRREVERSARAKRGAR